jgi:2-polyprenyl-3-methyl-5-hydroxy-6-metoxy-1,4-benzoquinol methylase
MTDNRTGCQTCGSTRLQAIDGFGTLPRVTSDSKPFRAGGKLFVCAGCGLAQKRVDAQWLAEITEIYREYDMYHQSGSHDQPVFDAVTGKPMGRSELLARHLMDLGTLPQEGKLLDVGAGSGAMLAAFSAAAPRWTLYGQDLDNRKEAALRTIPQFRTLLTVPPPEVRERFNLITLIHSLEHFTEPLAMLRSLAGLLSPGGRIFVQVNNLERTPFDLVVADHLCHFTPGTLQAMIARAGFAAERSATEWVPKEISLLASGGNGAAPQSAADPQQAVATVRREVAWLQGMVAHARERACSGRFGIFGTSVAATWLDEGLPGAAQFFVDEDPSRNGRSHFGRPILQPKDVPADAVVYLAFVPEVAAAIRNRLGGLASRLIVPPAAPGGGEVA